MVTFYFAGLSVLIPQQGKGRNSCNKISSIAEKNTYFFNGFFIAPLKTHLLWLVASIVNCDNIAMTQFLQAFRPQMLPSLVSDGKTVRMYSIFNSDYHFLYYLHRESDYHCSIHMIHSQIPYSLVSKSLCRFEVDALR